MNARPHVQPLPYKARKRTFTILLVLFVVSLPFLYLYATGNRFESTNFIATGGIYIGVERTGAEIYVDDELVRETRAFRKAFYAQNLDAGTHRVHVQKEGYHTWVKELPVSAHLVTEVQAFNMPLIPLVRVIAEWETATGTMVVRTPLVNASTTNEVLVSTTTVTSTFTKNTEFKAQLINFIATTTATTSPKSNPPTKKNIDIGLNQIIEATSTLEATTTKESNGVQLYESGDDVYAHWVGKFEEMPYYYCAAEFPRYSTSTATTTAPIEIVTEEPLPIETSTGNELIHPVQTIPKDVACDPTIKIDRKWQKISSFEFFPGNTDLVLLALEDGIYVVEIDDRSWQNSQPLIMGKNLMMHIENGLIYVFDGTLIYQVILEK